jgi:regulator of sigma E protease
VSYFLTFVGFAVLIVLHEAGHFAAAKAVGMRVERFSLFFGKLLVKTRRGETEYGIGWLPLGGYVKITGMSPHEELTPELEARAYYNQPPWKRIVVILAGPFVNVLLAFVILFGVYLSIPTAVVRDGRLVSRGTVVETVEPNTPAAGRLRAGDRIVAVDGSRNVSENALVKAISGHRCAGPQVSGCLARTPARIEVRRDGALRTLTVRPRYDAAAKRMEIGFEMSILPVTRSTGPVGAARAGIDQMWYVTHVTVSRIVQLFEPKDRRQLHSVVGAADFVNQAFSYSATEAFGTLALISLSLAIINLFPFLPLDGGHVFWAVAEKLRGRRIAFSVMERAGMVGFALILVVFAIGLSNDISGIANNTLKLPH